MSTVCLTVHELRMLLNASEEGLDCCHGHATYTTEIAEKKTTDYWSARYQLQPSDLDQAIDHRDGSDVKDGETEREHA